MGGTLFVASQVRKTPLPPCPSSSPSGFKCPREVRDGGTNYLCYTRWARGGRGQQQCYVRSTVRSSIGTRWRKRRKRRSSHGARHCCRHFARRYMGFGRPRALLGFARAHGIEGGDARAKCLQRERGKTVSHCLQGELGGKGDSALSRIPRLHAHKLI